MNASLLKDQLLNWTLAHNGVEQRAYLGMSGISECPLELYRRMLGERQFDQLALLRFYEGYLAERDMLARLAALGLLREGSPGREIVSKIDPRFKGHIDGELTDGSLLEIKSTNEIKLAGVIAEGRMLEEHFQQVQCYLRHGGYEWGYVIYKSRDSGRIFVVGVRPVERVGDRLDEKARRILAAVDRQQPPRCECRRCKVPAAFEPG
jgi:hypothetical protein